MDFNLSPEQSRIQTMAREFAQQVIDPVAEVIDRENRLPPEVSQGLGELGFFGLPFSPDHGGTGAGYDCYVLAMEQIAWASTGPAMMISAHSLALGAIDKFGTEEQKTQWMTSSCQGKTVASFAFTEPETGSDPKQITTTAVEDGDAYVINGTKRFISNADYPGPIVLFAKDSASGKPTAFIVEKLCPGYTLSTPWQKIGLHGGSLYDIYLKNVRIPKSQLLGTLGGGYQILQFAISFGKIGVCSVSLGGMLAARQASEQYAREKTDGNIPIASLQMIQLKIADLAGKYEASRWLAYRLGCLGNNPGHPMVFAKEAALTKTFVCDTAVDVARIAMDIHGPDGLLEAYKVSRIYRDAIMGPQVEGVSDMQKLITAGVILSK